MSQTHNKAVDQSVEIALRLGIVILILAWCFQILSPFISLILWGAIIAVSINTPFLKLSKKLNGNKKRASALITVGTIAAIIIPVILLSGSLIDEASSLGKQIKLGTLEIPPPSESVQSWPLVGEKVYTTWSESSNDLSDFAKKHSEQLKIIGHKLVAIATAVSSGIFQFLISMIIAGVFLANVSSISPAMKRFMNRLAGDKGDDILTLTTATIQSITVGVIGIAFIQGLLSGIAMMAVDIPGAGLLAFLIFVTAIAQIPGLLLAIPIVIYEFSVAEPTVAIIFGIWMILVAMCDVVLKPLLLGRGVNAPMLVILLGAIGGMILSGVVGLFTGSVILALGYTLFQAWLKNTESGPTSV
jgi:predicted PurR-regulated permease PerM